MKRHLVGKSSLCTIVAITFGGLLTACGSNPTNYAQQSQQDYQAQAQREYRLQEKAVTQAINEAPAWMYKLPKESGIIYENGTAISSDFSMADLKAKTMAYVKICTGAGGKVRSQMKMYRADNEAASTEQSELTVRSLCPDVDISGVETVEMKHVAEGNRIRTYVLVALPMGQKNAMKSTKDLQNRSGEAFKELDGITKEQLKESVKEPSKEQALAPIVSPVQPSQPISTSKPEVVIPPVSQAEPTLDQATPQTNQGLKMNVRPATKIDGSMMDSVQVVRPDSVIVQTPDGSQKQIDLIGSKNPEYLARRAEALNKPGALIGQATIK